MARGSTSGPRHRHRRLRQLPTRVHSISSDDHINHRRSFLHLDSTGRVNYPRGSATSTPPPASTTAETSRSSDRLHLFHRPARPGGSCCPKILRRPGTLPFSTGIDSNYFTDRLGQAGAAARKFAGGKNLEISATFQACTILRYMYHSRVHHPPS